MTDGPGTDAGAERTAQQLVALGAATIGESGGSPLSPRIRSMWPGAAVAGPAYPVQCGPTDNLAIHAAVAEAPPGSILCVEIPGDPERGYWGEVLTTGAQARGIVGLVIDGGVRDADALERLRFPVFAHGFVLRGAQKDVPGRIGVTATVGGEVVGRGDWLIADRDGVAVIRREAFDDVIIAGVARADKEIAMFEALRDGATTVDLLGLDTSAVERP